MQKERKARGSRAPLVIALCVAFVATGAIVWRKVIRDHVIPKNFGVVEDGRLYRAGVLTPSTLRKVVDEHGVRTVIDLGANHRGTPADEALARQAEKLGIRRVTLWLEGDGTGNPNCYVETLRVMTDPAAQPVLVHCSAGAQRTGAAVMLYRTVVQGWSVDRAYEEAQGYRHDPVDDWKMLAFFAEWDDRVRAAYEVGGWIEGFEPTVSPMMAGDPAEDPGS